MRRLPRTAICAVLLCAFALVVPAAAHAATGHGHPGLHAVKLIPAQVAENHYAALRLDTPNLSGTTGVGSPDARYIAVTATSSKIVSGTTVESPRTRGPPAEGRS